VSCTKMRRPNCDVQCNAKETLLRKKHSRDKVTLAGVVRIQKKQMA